MFRPKTEEEIELLRINGDLVSRTLAEVGKLVAPGVTTAKLNEVAETFIRDHGAVPSFKGFDGFPAALCMSVNDVVVHGFPSDRPLEEGDIVSVDCGTLYKGYNGDSAYTFPVGEVDAETRKLLDVTKASLYKGIEAAVAGNRTGDIGYAVQSYAESFGFSVVRELEGHGVGKEMHEDPQVPNFIYAEFLRREDFQIKPGLVIAIEPMVNVGGKRVKQLNDFWTVTTSDGSLSAHEEHTVAITKSGPFVLTGPPETEEERSLVDQFYSRYRSK